MPRLPPGISMFLAAAFTAWMLYELLAHGVQGEPVSLPLGNRHAGTGSTSIGPPLSWMVTGALAAIGAGVTWSCWRAWRRR